MDGPNVHCMLITRIIWQSALAGLPVGDDELDLLFNSGQCWQVTYCCNHVDASKDTRPPQGAFSLEEHETTPNVVVIHVNVTSTAPHAAQVPPMPLSR